MCMNVRWDASGLRQLMQHYHKLKLSTNVQLGYRVLGCINVARYARKASQYSAVQNDAALPCIKTDT